MKIGFLITGRMKSTRLPRKLTLKLNGREVIRWMIDRLKLNHNINEIIICTSINTQDDVLEKIAEEEKIEIFRGVEDDVIQRLNDAAIQFNLDYALNITADCPLVSINYISKIIKKYQETKADLIRTLDLPHGFYSYGLKPDALKKVCEIKKGENTEVWGKYFTDTGDFNVVDIEIPDSLKRADYRLTLDYKDDYEFFKAVYKHFGDGTYKTGIKDIIKYLDKHPEIVNINQHCKELYQKKWESQNIIEL